MAVSTEDLRVQLKIASDDWDADDVEFAGAILTSARVSVESIAGPSAVQIAVASEDAAKLAALDQSQLVWAKLMFANPERVMQRRQGSDYSVSFADSSTAALGMREVEAILSGHFSLGRAQSVWQSNDVTQVWL